MDANLEVRKAQRQWARSMGIWFDSSGYVRDIQDNLWQPLSPHAHRCFSRGAGSELNERQREYIRAERSKGVSQRDLAKRLEVSRWTIQQVDR